MGEAQTSERRSAQFTGLFSSTKPPHPPTPHTKTGCWFCSVKYPVFLRCWPTPPTRASPTRRQRRLSFVCSSGIRLLENGAGARDETHFSGIQPQTRHTVTHTSSHTHKNPHTSSHCEGGCTGNQTWQQTPFLLWRIQVTIGPMQSRKTDAFKVFCFS